MFARMTSADPTWLPETEEIVNLLPRRVSRLARMLYRASGSSLPRGMRSVLFALASEPLRISQVAQQEGIGQPAATRMVGRLEALDLVRRERSASDRRVVMVTLTERGLEELEHLRDESRRVMREVLRGRTARELRQFQEASDTLELLISLVQSGPAEGARTLAQPTSAASSRRRTRRALPS
jgi:DNA-binding MarR family transcriptional regulator